MTKQDSYFQKAKALKDIRAQLLSEEDTYFIIKGLKNRVYKIVTSKYGNDEYTLRSVELVDDISFICPSMNVKEITPTQIKLYTFDMFNNQSKESVKLEDITIVDKPEEV